MKPTTCTYLGAILLLMLFLIVLYFVITNWTFVVGIAAIAAVLGVFTILVTGYK